jgi:hypothetical protein
MARSAVLSDDSSCNMRRKRKIDVLLAGWCAVEPKFLACNM